MKIVIDTSTLISLAKIDAIDLLKNINGELICPHEVFREAVVEGKDKGHQDAEIINHIFNSGLVAAVTATDRLEIDGISKTDSTVIFCTIEQKANYLFANDTKRNNMNSEVVRINARLTKDLLRELDSYAKQHYEDRSTALRQLLAGALKDISRKAVINDYKNNKITLREAAEKLGATYWEAQDILIEAGASVQKLTEEEIQNRRKKVKTDVF